nr:LCP family protein [Ancylothrix sp. D3o]
MAAVTGRSVFWGFGLLVTAAMSATLGATLALMTPLSLPISDFSGKPSLREIWQKNFQYRITRPVNVLIMGIDRLNETPLNRESIFEGNSDTLLLLGINPSNKTVNMLSIPRDTQVEIPGIGIDKINDANVKGGPALAARVLSSNLNDIAIDRYVRISTGAFRELVDLLGGVDVFVPYPMQYVDETQKLKIDLPQGWQTLNGDQAEQFARFRNDNKGDIGRVQRQQALFKELKNRLTSPAVLPRLPEIIRAMQKYIDTNLSFEEMLSLVNFSLNLQPENFKMVMLPGRFSSPDEFKASYWLMDTEERDRVMLDYFQVSPKQKTAQEDAVENLPPEPRSSKIKYLYKVAIQNASDSPEIADNLAKYLQDQGYENVYVVQDWPDRLLQTQIIVQKGDLESAAKLKQTLGLGKIASESTGDLESDLTIRIGQDWVKANLQSSPLNP